MSQISRVTTWTAGQTLTASAQNGEFNNLLNAHNNHDSGSSVWTRLLATSGSSVPLVINNSTGSNDIVNFQDNGTNVFSIADGGAATFTVVAGTAIPVTINNSTSTGDIAKFQDNGTDVLRIIDGGDIYMNAAKKLYLDGGGNTYIVESSADVISVFTNETSRMTFNTTVGVSVVGANDFSIPTARKLYLDGGSNTYITESSGDDITFGVAGSENFQINNTTGVRVLNVDLNIPTTRKLYLDGGGDTYIYESAANTFGLLVGGSQKLSVTTTECTFQQPISVQDTGGLSTLLTLTQAGISARGLQLTSSNASYAGSHHYVSAVRTANSAYNFFLGESDTGGTPDTEVRLRGDGNGTCDGSWTGGGADYAEMFESIDGNPIDPGTSVVLVADKVCPCVEGQDPIGVVSVASTVVGNNKLNWNEKYQKDDFGGYVLDEKGDRILNPEYDKDSKYIPRNERKEWVQVGLMGQIPVAKGQPVSPRWIKMAKENKSAQWYLVR